MPKISKGKDLQAPEPTGTIWDYASANPVADSTAEWRPSEHKVGIAMFAPWEDPFGGFPEHSRRLARAIDSAGAHVHLRSVDPTTQWEINFEMEGEEKFTVREEYSDLLDKSIADYLVEIHHIVPNDEYLHKLVHHPFLDPKVLAKVNKFRIVSTVWERDRISDSAVRCLNQMGQLWVANHQDKEMLQRCGVKRDIYVIPIPFYPNDPLLELNNRKRFPGPVRFYHIGKWEPRKAHHELLGTFMKAFKPGEATLYFKTSSGAPNFGDYPNCPEASFAHWISDDQVKENGWKPDNVNKSIFVMRQRLSSKQMISLHKTGDVYVSLSRGEGFDMCAYDAKLAGNLLVFTPSGGPQDFAGSEDELVAPTGTLKAHSWYKWGDGRYLDWPREEAAQALRRAREKVLAGARCRGKDLSTFSAKAVGKKALACVNKLLEERETEQLNLSLNKWAEKVINK